MESESVSFEATPQPRLKVPINRTLWTYHHCALRTRTYVHTYYSMGGFSRIVCIICWFALGQTGCLSVWRPGESRRDVCNRSQVREREPRCRLHLLMQSDRCAATPARTFNVHTAYKVCACKAFHHIRFTL